MPSLPKLLSALIEALGLQLDDPEPSPGMIAALLEAHQVITEEQDRVAIFGLPDDDDG